MLSLSAELSDTEVDLQLINGHHSGESNVPYASELMKFAEAVASRDATVLDDAREALLKQAGPEVLVDAAGVAGNFQRMVRIADCSGIPLDDIMMAASADIPDQLGLRRFGSGGGAGGGWGGGGGGGVGGGWLFRSVMRKADQRANST